MTNGDRIRMMSDKELAEFMETIFITFKCKYCSCKKDDEKCKKTYCVDSRREWLEQEEAKW